MIVLDTLREGKLVNIIAVVGTRESYGLPR
jgi:hypothetical protein